MCTYMKGEWDWILGCDNITHMADIIYYIFDNYMISHVYICDELMWKWWKLSFRKCWENYNVKKWCGFSCRLFDILIENKLLISYTAYKLHINIILKHFHFPLRTRHNVRILTNPHIWHPKSIQEFIIWN